MKLTTFRDNFIGDLTPIYDCDEAASLFYIVLEHLHGMRRVDLALQPDFELSDSELRRWNEILCDLKEEQPIQYLLGQADFYGLKLKVTPDVLIPRQETEELVDWIIKDFQAKSGCSVLDIGTGSGCIPISLAKNLKNAKVSAIDVSEKALVVARENASTCDVQVQFILMDILSADALSEKYDIIVSNPPYVRMLEKHEIRKNVLDHEPHLALFVEDDDPLLFYRKIAALAKKSLNPGGRLYFEINQYLGNETVEMLRGFFDEVILRKDINGNDRMICAYS